MENSWPFQKNTKENKAHTIARSTNGSSNKEGANTQCHCMTQGQFIHGIKRAYACKEESLGLQLQGSSDWKLAGLWPYCSWPACCLCETPTGILWVILNSQNYLKKKKKAKGTFPSGPFWCVTDFAASNLAAWRPAELQVVLHPTHSACNTFKQQQILFTHELTKRPLADSPKTVRERKEEIIQNAFVLFRRVYLSDELNGRLVSKIKRAATYGK